MLEFDEAARMAQMFGRLSEGARITVPLGRMYWGSDFGMSVDAFGVQWMFSHSPDDRPRL